MELQKPSLLSPSNNNTNNGVLPLANGSSTVTEKVPPTGPSPMMGAAHSSLIGAGQGAITDAKLNGPGAGAFASATSDVEKGLSGLGIGTGGPARLGGVPDSNTNALTVQKRLPKEETVVFFRGVTWMRDSHGLFDYESRNISKKNLKTKYVGKIIRQSNTIEFISPTTSIEDLPGYNKDEFLTLAQIKQDNKGFYIEHGDTNAEEESIDRLWLVVRSLKNPEGKFDYKIKKFDAIKLGRVRFRVKDFRCEQMNLTTRELYNQELKEAQTVKTAKDFTDGQETVQCRFCWCPEESDDNPLILACKCRGSVGLIHFECLKNWIKTQRHVKEYGENVTSYYWKKFECEICKQSYPYIFKKGQTLFKLIDINEPKPGSQYILLESMPLDKNTSRNIHMLTVTDKKSDFKLGRGHESEVRINDISVSRCHAIIKCRKDGFYIEDNLSKFGTIVLLKNTLRLAEDHTMAVQVGRSVVSFTIKNIDVDRKMREKLKREIAPLLSKNKNLSTSANANKASNKPLASATAGSQAQGGIVPADHALNPGVNPIENSMIGSGITAPHVGVLSAERAPRQDLQGVFSASREGKRLNMLGFNTNNLLDNGREGAQDSIPANERRHAAAADLGRTYGASHINQQPSGPYGATSSAHPGNGATSGTNRGDMGLLSQSGVSHSALVNSGNAAILGHNSFKLNNNGAGAANLGNGPATLGSTYGALGNQNSMPHGGQGGSQLSRDNIFTEMNAGGQAQHSMGAHHVGASRLNGGSIIGASRDPPGYAEHLKYGGVTSAQVQGAGQAQRSSSYAHRAPASSHGPLHSSQRTNQNRQGNMRSRE